MAGRLEDSRMANWTPSRFQPLVTHSLRVRSRAPSSTVDSSTTLYWRGPGARTTGVCPEPGRFPARRVRWGGGFAAFLRLGRFFFVGIAVSITLRRVRARIKGAAEVVGPAVSYRS